MYWSQIGGTCKSIRRFFTHSLTAASTLATYIHTVSISQQVEKGHEPHGAHAKALHNPAMLPSTDPSLRVHLYLLTYTYFNTPFEVDVPSHDVAFVILQPEAGAPPL